MDRGCAEQCGTFRHLVLDLSPWHPKARSFSGGMVLSSLALAEGREGIAFFRLLGCITLLPGALKAAVLCSLTVLHSLKLLKYQYRLFYTICKVLYVSDTHVQVISCSQDIDACPRTLHLLEFTIPGFNAVVDWGSNA